MCLISKDLSLFMNVNNFAVPGLVCYILVENDNNFK